MYTVQDWDNNGAKKHLAKATERNVKICNMRVRLATFHVGSKACYFGLVAMWTVVPNDRAIILGHF